ncbi:MULTISPECIES: hypothetical protein [unclassified Leptolyngbya]|uniref:hypothetical protein n=1 Tax=unclassified Leptolyngbya TaxID=2650499 RepID=UPI0016867254|nr:MULTISPECIES: hypothetical protein [unclassified Leptolyngbya]MBD1912903.1 hypothetical protein [Leptolyngbya sp. FACHB-8]MBD2154768.1 hypothetical protein [Leptolyngbya sp. FACHB-16]
MNLPLVFDIALGLIFIFLTLSLLASEVQELIATLLQWRAEHLKRSIENLILGQGEQDPAYQEFVNELYRSPLIRALNQEAKGILPRFFRDVVHGSGSVVRSVTGRQETFGGNRTGPSYIPAPSFAEALLQKLGIDGLAQQASELTLRQLCRERITMLERLLQSLRNSAGDDSLLAIEFESLKRQLIEITRDFKGNRIPLSLALEQAIAQISQFLDNTERFLDHNDQNYAIIRTRLPFLRQSILQKKLEPTIYELLEVVVRNDVEVPAELAETVQELRQRLRFIPPELRSNILSLAQQAQLKASNLRDGVRQLQAEIETWFDRSMDRASGVYRRNAKGFAIILGILTAMATNADAFLMVERLSQDTAIRTALTQTTDQLISQQFQRDNFPDAVGGTTPDIPTNEPGNPTEVPTTGEADARALEQNLSSVKDALGDVLGDIPLPLGWNSDNLRRQFPAESNRFLTIPKSLLGWLVTGIAISMGSSFWFDLLGKIVRVRNTGTPTKPSSSD